MKLREVNGEWAVFLNRQLYEINRLSSAFNYLVILMTTVRGDMINARNDQVIYMRDMRHHKGDSRRIKESLKYLKYVNLTVT